MSKFIVRPDVDVVAMLKAAGYSTYVIRKSKALGESTVQKFRGDDKQLPSWAELAKLCDLLHASPVDLIAFQADDGTVTTFDSVPPVTLATLPEPVPAPVPEPEPMPDTVTDDAVTVTLSPSQLRNMDGAISCNYAPDRVQYVQRAIDAQIQRDIETEKAKRRAARSNPPFTVQHGHPGDAGYDPDDPGEYPDIDDDY